MREAATEAQPEEGKYPNMINPRNKRAVYGCAFVLIGLGTAGAVNLPSIRALLATQREVTVQAL